MELLSWLQQFHPIGDDDWQEIASKLKPGFYKKGSILTNPGQVQRELFFVRDGVQMSYISDDENDKMHVMAFTYAPGLCAIPDSFMLQQPSAYSLTCLTDSRLDALRFEDLQILFDRSQQIERLFRKMSESILAGLIKRHQEWMMLSMEDRYREFCRRSPHLLRLSPHKYIASYLSIDPTNFSKLYNNIRI